MAWTCIESSVFLTVTRKNCCLLCWSCSEISCSGVSESVAGVVFLTTTSDGQEKAGKANQ